jgi:hypothetical protein
MRKHVEACHRSELTDVTAKVVSNMPIDLTALKLGLQIGEHLEIWFYGVDAAKRLNMRKASKDAGFR